MADDPSPGNGVPTALDTVPIPLVTTNAELRVVSANRAARGLLGEDLVGRSLLDCVEAHDHPRATALRDGDLARAVLSFRGRAGPVGCEVRLHAGPDGTRLLTLTELERGEVAARWTAHQRDALVLVEGSRLEVSGANPAAAELLGGRRGFTLPDRLSTEQAAVLRARLASSAAPAAFELVVGWGRGARVPVEVLATRLPDAGERWLLALRDLRARHAAEARRAVEREQQLEQREAEVVGGLAVGVSAELSRVVRALAPSAARDEGVRGVVSEVADLADALARLGPRPRPTGVVELCDVVRRVAAQVARTGATVVPVISADAAPVAGRAEEWTTALVGLARSVLELQPHGGAVEFALWRVRSTFWVEVRGTLPSVLPGWSAEASFRPYGLAGAARGAALALPAARAFARDHGCTLTARGEPGGPPTFSLTGRMVAGERAGVERLSLLLIEDDEVVRRSLARILGRDHAVREAEDGPQGLAILAATPIEVVVCDLHLGPASGLEVASEIRRRWPEVKLVLVSGYVDPPLLAQALPTVDAVLEKPFSAEAFARALADLRRARTG